MAKYWKEKKEFSCSGVKLESSEEMKEAKHIKVKGILR
jgi:hypothetical protein